jgi:phosphate transport system ATP-binding protein
MDQVTPPPVRRIAVDREPQVVAPTAIPNGASATAARPSVSARLRAERPAVGSVRERMRVESVWLAYGDNWVVRDVSLPVRQGEVLALIGASGSGKTTLLRSLNRLTEVTAGAARAGQISLDGEEIHGLEVNALRRRVSMVFQQPNPFPMSIFDNVAYALAEQSPPRGRRRRRSAELEHAVHDALRRAGL